MEGSGEQSFFAVFTLGSLVVGGFWVVFRKRPGKLCTLTLTGANRHFNCCAVLTVFSLFVRTGFNCSRDRANAVFNIFATTICFVPFVNNVLTSGFNFNGVIAANIFIVFTNCTLLSVPAKIGLFNGVLVFKTLTLVTYKANLFGNGLRIVINGLCSSPRCGSGHSATFDLFCVTVGVNTLFTPATTAGVAGCILKVDKFACDPRLPTLTRRCVSGTTNVATRSTTGLRDLGTTRGFSNSALDFYGICLRGLTRSCGCNFTITYISLVISVYVCCNFHDAFGRTSCGTGATPTTNNIGTRRLSPTRAGRHVITLYLIFTIIVFF